MKLTKTERLILYSLGEFYDSLNQRLISGPVKIQTSKIAFIEMLLKSEIITKQERSIYKNLESLEKKKLIGYESRMIKFTGQGLKILNKIKTETRQFLNIKDYFVNARSKRKLQTIIKN